MPIRVRRTPPRARPPLRLGLLRRVREEKPLPPTPPEDWAKFLRAYHRALGPESPVTLEELFAERGMRLEDWPEPKERIERWDERSRNFFRKPLSRGVPEKHKAKWRNDEEYLFSNPVTAERILSGYVRALKWAGEPVPDDLVAELADLRERLGIAPE